MVFAFFTLVFALVMWINRAVTLFDELVTDGHSAKVFLEFSVLALPTVAVHGFARIRICRNRVCDITPK